LCAGEKIARGFDASIAPARTIKKSRRELVRREISAKSVRAERAQGDKIMTRACAWGGCSRAFESNATRDAKKLGLMPF
jgi:hypothetical protein